jgi:hypothetical protein
MDIPDICMRSDGRFETIGVSAWLTMEGILKSVTDNLIARCGFGFPTPPFVPTPTSFGYGEIWDSYEEALARLRQAYNAFYLMLSFCSMAIHLQYFRRNSNRKEASIGWQSFLVCDKGLPVEVVQSLACSWVGEYPVQRRGCFIALDNTPDEELWHAFTSAGVPVFFAWGVNPATIPLLPAYLECFRPWRTAVDEARKRVLAWDAVGSKSKWQQSEAVGREPSNSFDPSSFEEHSFEYSEHSELSITNDESGQYPENHASDSNQSGFSLGSNSNAIADNVKCFASPFDLVNLRRQLRDKIIASGETPEAKMKRENLEQNALEPLNPGKKCKATYYELSYSDGIYTAQLLSRKAAQDMWKRYEPSQRFFCSIKNEWYFCDELDPNATSDEDEDYDYEGIPNIATPNRPGQGDSTAVLKVHSQQLFDMYPELPGRHPQINFPPTTLPVVLAESFGLIEANPSMVPQNVVQRMFEAVCMITLESCQQSISNKEKETCSAFVSCLAYRTANVSTPEQHVPPEMWDLTSRSRHPLSDRLHPHLQFQAIVMQDPPTLYLLTSTLPTDNTTWHLAVSPAVALRCLRTHTFGPSLPEVARQLIDKGIPFFTLNQVSQPPRVEQQPPPLFAGLGWRDYGWNVDREFEYKSYTYHRDRILRGPRGRVALMMGGIVWRLAKDVVPVEAVISGPNTQFSGPKHILKHNYDQVFLDDRLTDHELSVICGVYAAGTYAGRSGTQTEEKSWWPKHETWERSNMNIGYWTPQCEAWFQKRLRNILTGTQEGELRGAGKWKTALTARAQTGKLRGNYDAAAAEAMRRL